MSQDAIWIPLSIDWWMSEMFDDATDGERLAWVILLCHVKAWGRAGKAKVRANDLARTYNLSVRAVLNMIKSAREHKAIETDGDTITICNWRLYNDKAYATQHRRNLRSGKTSVSSLPVPVPVPVPVPSTSTETPLVPLEKKTSKPRTRFDPHTLPLPPPLDTSPEFTTAWAAWIVDRRDRGKPLTLNAATRQLNQLATMTSEDACELIDHAITRGWTGLRADWLANARSQPSSGPAQPNAHAARNESAADRRRATELRRDYPEPDTPVPSDLGF